MAGKEVILVDTEQIYSKHDLTPYEKKFIDHYCSYQCKYNARLAMMFCLYDEEVDDPDERNQCAVKAHRLLQKLHIIEAIDDIRKAKVENMKQTEENILKELEMVANFDITSIMDDNGIPLPFHMIPTELRTIFTEMIEYGADGKIKVKLQNKQNAQKMLLEYQNAEKNRLMALDIKEEDDVYGEMVAQLEQKKRQELTDE